MGLLEFREPSYRDRALSINGWRSVSHSVLTKFIVLFQLTSMCVCIMESNTPSPIFSSSSLALSLCLFSTLYILSLTNEKGTQRVVLGFRLVHLSYDSMEGIGLSIIIPFIALIYVLILQASKHLDKKALSKELYTLVFKSRCCLC